MSRQKITSALLVFALAGLNALAGCTSEDAVRSGKPQTSPTQDFKVQQGPGASEGEMRTVSGWPSMKSDDSMAWSALAYPTGNPSTSSIGLEKGFPREVRLNQTFVYKIAVTNLTNRELTNVVVRDEVETGMRVVGTKPQAQEVERNMLAWSMGTLGPKQTKVVEVQATPLTEGSVGSCARVEHDFLLCNTVPVVAPALRLTKAGPTEVLRCDAITYQFEVTNTGTGTVRNVRISDELPAGLTSSSGGRTLTFNAGNLAAGTSKKFNATVQAERTGRFVNRATASGDGLNVNSNEVATVVRAPALKITKTCPPQQYVGRPTRYEITVTNTGDGIARDTVIEDTLPSGAAFVSASDNGRAAGGKVTWNVGSLRPNASKTVTLNVNPSDRGTYRNTAMARAHCADPVSDACTTEVKGIPAILLEVVDIEDPDEVGTTETYVVTVTNQGSATDTNIRIVATLEPNQTFESSTGPTRGTARGNTVTFDPLPSIAPKAQATWRIVVNNVRAGDVRFKITLNSDELTRPVEETEATNIYE